MSDQPQTSKITRIDFFVRLDGISVMKYADGWRANTPAIERSIQQKMTLDEMLTWLEKQGGWTIRRWGKYGARAWYGKLMPIRTRSQIIHRRDNYSQMCKYHGLDATTLDFAYDL